MTKKLTYREALGEGLRYAFQNDPRVFMMGEDIGKYKGTFRVTDGFDNVRGMVWGHVHQAFDGMREGVMLMGTPSTCVQFEPGSTKFTLDERPPGYRWLHLYPDGRIDTRVEWVEGEG